jgi:SAM-dependent methyltransferase
MSDKKVFNTYKSIWIQDLSTGNYERQQKQKYPLESFINSLAPLIKPVPKVRGLIPFLGKKAQGADFYKYYIDYIISGNRGKWTGEMEAVIKRLHELGLSLEGKSILDVSGEPGFFASDMRSLASKVVVTVFAKEVADAMIEYLGVEALKYDFNNDILSEAVNSSKFDFIFVRYAIGFCEDLDFFFKNCIKVLNTQGFLWISFSPASRAVCARWMFDDYTYLRQYTKEYLVYTAVANGFQCIKEWDDGSYDWDTGLHSVQKIFSLPYTFKLFQDVDANERKQHNVVVLFQRIT